MARIAHVIAALNALEQLVADVALASGRLLSPLHGVPFSVKDWIDAAGLPS